MNSHRGMSPKGAFRTALLAAYLAGSLLLRAGVRRWLQIRGRAPVTVLFYHRISDDRRTPWTTSVDAFCRQILWLKRHCRIVSLAEAQRHLAEGRSRRPLVAITFDDGYADNCRHALPLLLEEGVPVTYFVTVENILTGKPFAHDVPYGEPAAPNTIDEIQSLAASGVEIGSHAWMHADFGRIFAPQRLYSELGDSKRVLEDLIGRPVRFFAFPFGCPRHLSRRAFRTAASVGYEAVCTAYGGYNLPGDDPFHIQRFHGDESLLRLIHRVTIDPRLLRVPRFQYALPYPPAFDAVWDGWQCPQCPGRKPPEPETEPETQPAV